MPASVYLGGGKSLFKTVRIETGRTGCGGLARRMCSVLDPQIVSIMSEEQLKL